MIALDATLTIFIKSITQLYTIPEDSDLNQNTKIHTKGGDLNQNTKIHTKVKHVGDPPSYAEVQYLRKSNQALKKKLVDKYRHIHHLKKRITELESDTLESQSGTVSDSQPVPGTNEVELSPSSSEQITAFADQDAGWLTTKVGTYDPTMDLANTSDSELGNFLKRPIRESAQSWIVGQPFFYKFNPWAAFCENPFVRDKIKNYELLRMKLNVKMVISGTKFHYGRALVSYNPFTAGDQVTVQRNFIPQDLIQASQKPHFFLNPTKNSGGELSLPFFWPNNYLRIPEGDWQDMGDIVISSFGNLLHANGGNDPVTITTYIWAEDIVLTVPTSSSPPTVLTSQSGRRTKSISGKDRGNRIGARDEYGQGIISKPASAVAKASGALSSLPMIGPYMRATEIGANATSRIAQLFGYSRPNIVSDIQQFKPLPAGNLANTDAADGAMKLTLDSKAELTVDSRTVGLDGSDEMGILDYVTRESYLTQFQWSPSDAADTLLWNTRVLPMQLDNVSGEIHMTPLAHMCSCFESWQGSLKFRFQIVKSDFHKGRILARWDPNQFSSAVDYNTNYSRVIDIAETDDFEIVVGWGQSVPWRECGTPYSTGSNFSSGVRLINSVGPAAQANGVLELAVLNDLVSPSADASISINVFVSACDDFKLAGPKNSDLSNYHLWPDPFDVLASQSSAPNVETGDMTMSDKPTASGELVTIGSKSVQDDPTYLVYYGDPPCSIRELCKRYVSTRFWYARLGLNNTVRLNRLTNKNAPYHTGWDPNGVDASTRALEPEGPPARLTVGHTAYHSWFTPAYAGVRGAYRKKYFFSAPTTRQTPVIARDTFKNSGNGSISASVISLADTAVQIQKFLSTRWAPNSGNASVATNLGINNTLEVELPYYMPKRFSTARTISAQQLDSNSHVVYTAEASGQDDPTIQHLKTLATNYQQHDAVGEDFTLFFFTGVPIYYEYALTESS